MPDDPAAREAEYARRIRQEAEAEAASRRVEPAIPRRFKQRVDFHKCLRTELANAFGQGVVESLWELLLRMGTRFSKKGPLLMGPTGTWKSHLLYAMCAEVAGAYNQEISDGVEKYVGLRMSGSNRAEAGLAAFPVQVDFLFTTGADLANELRRAVAKGSSEDVVEKYRQSWAVKRSRYPVLFVDDIEVMKMGDWLGEELHRIVDFRYKEELPMAVATNLGIEELRGHFGDRIARRLIDMCVPFVLKPRKSAR